MPQETTPFVSAEQETLPPTDPLTPPGGAPGPFPGEFALERCLGRGAFGEVWLARDLSPLGRLVALKFLRLAGSSQRREQALAVLHNEARVLASLRHPNIVQVHAWKHATASTGPCLVLQYVPGGSLADRVTAQGPLPWQVAGRYVADCADGLLLVHTRGLIHRDVKPANMLLDVDSDEALLTDFGIAARLADTGFVAGTPLFMAPEAHDGAVSASLDVYGLAASLFWLVAGQPPFDGADPLDLARNVRRGLPDREPRLAGVPASLEELIRAGLAARPEDRPGLAEFVRRLRGALNLLLADCLPQPGTSGVDLRLIVSRQVDRHTCVPVASTMHPAEQALRDFRRVPRPPRRVGLRTGDRVRLEVEADQPGYVTVFNVGPSGNLNLLYPPEPGAAPPLLPARRTLHITDVELTPPAGQERLFALWTRAPLPLRLEELRSLVEQGTVPAGGAYRATRDMVRVQQSLSGLPPEDRQAVVLELDHE
jgi:serine/threonine protein kinase